MFKNLLVVLEETPEVVTAYAVSLAKRLEARVTVIRPRRDAAGLSDGSMEARLELARGDYETRKARAKEAVEAFGDKAKEAGVEAELLFPDEGADPRRDSVAAFARVFDFAIVGQPEPGRPPHLDEIAGQLLSESGRPALVVPAIQRGAADFSSIAVAWDGSAASARAFGDAMMIFERAAKVEIVSITGPNTPKSVLQGGERISAQACARRGECDVQAPAERRGYGECAAFLHRRHRRRNARCRRLRPFSAARGAVWRRHPHAAVEPDAAAVFVALTRLARCMSSWKLRAIERWK